MQVTRPKQFLDNSGDSLQFLEPGHVIASRYRVKRPLGRGGMGSVYLAEDLVLGVGEIAVKVLRRGGVEEHAAVNRFLREVRLTHKIQHENVVRTFDFGQDGELIFYTMVYLPGQSLDVAITEGGLPYHTVVDIAAQLIRGISAVHAVGVVHRDVKPENIIVNSDGTLKITDFGIARADSTPATIFASDVLGTLRYVAPEVLRGNPATSAVDYYALGVVLFELLSGRAPFREINPAQLILSKIEDDVPSIASFRSDIPKWFVNGVDQLLAHEPNVRVKAAQAFAVELDKHTSIAKPLTERASADRHDYTVRLGLLERISERARPYVHLSLIQCLCVVLCSLFALPISRTDIFAQLEASYDATLFRLRGRATPHPNIAVISMDEQSYASLGVPLTSPWPRSLHAKLLTNLADAGAKRVVFDIIFADADLDNKDDQLLAAAMKRVPTVLGAALGLSQRATINGAFLLEELLQPAELFEVESVGTGVVGLPYTLGRVGDFPRVSSAVFPNVTTLAEMAVALDRDEARLPSRDAHINFYGPGKTIPTMPYELVVGPESGHSLAELFSGKIVFVGLGLRSSTGPSQRDAFVTPFDQQTFGAEIHATAASNLLLGDWIQQSAPLVRALVSVGCAMLLSLIVVSLSGPLALVLLVSSLALIGAVQYVVFLAGWLTPCVAGCVWGIFIGLLLRILGAQPVMWLRRRGA